MSLSKRAARGLGFAFAVPVCVALAWRPMQYAAAGAIVVAPNRGRAAPAPSEGEIRVDVGPPAASLSLAIMDPQGTPRATVFVLHGIRDSKVHMRGWGEMLARVGLRAVLVDLLGHGRSTGDSLSYGVLDSADLRQALDALTARGLIAGKVGVMGVSYGGATSIEWAAADPRVQAVVAVAPFASLREVVPGYAPFPLPASFVNGAIDLAGKQGGFDPDDASPVRAITRTHAPVLLFHGDVDERIPFWHSERIAAAGKGHTELVRVMGATHETIPNDPVVHARAPEWLSAKLAP